MKVIPLHTFEIELKHLYKKYPSIKEDLDSLVLEIVDRAPLGMRIVGGAYKVRLKITSKNQGKSVGARVIFYYKMRRSRVFLLSIYDKSEVENLADKVILNLIKEVELLDSYSQ